MTITFRDLGVAHQLCDALESKGIVHPFPIQELSLPLALKGSDLIGQARTGMGKTLAFGLPLLQRIDPSARHTQALIVVPTRELCLQVYADLQIGERLGITSIAVYGGVGYDEQIDALTGGAHVVVGTPGRLLDHLDRRNLDLSKVTQLVLDEADEMLDMGFLPDVERLIEACTGPSRHTMLFSATMPTAIVKLARQYMNQPTFTRADQQQVDTAPTVEQHFFKVHRMDKPRVLARILQDRARKGVFVFVRTKHMADRLVRELEELSTPAIAIHGDLRQTTRERNLDRFRSGKASVLVATEVAARGLDVSGVTHVVNYDCPDDDKMYLHRIGRTARAGQDGVAVTFAEHNEADRLNVIRKAVGAGADEVVDIFSTSDELARRFDLPDETPWSHLSRPSGGRADNRSNGRGGGRNDRPKRSRPSGSSDRNTPTSRTSTSKGSASSGTTSSGSATSGSATSGSATSGSTTSGSTKANSTTHAGSDASSQAPSGGTANSQDRSRSRSRTRSSGTTSAGATEGGSRGAKVPAGDATPASDATPTDRAPQATTSAASGTDDASKNAAASSRSGSGRPRARRSRGDRQGGGGGAKNPGAKDPQGREQPARSGKKPSGKGQSGRRAQGHGRTDDRSETGRSDERGSEGSRGGRPAGNGGQRGGRDRQRPSNGTERRSGGQQPAAATQGQPARGDGQPSSARQVKVEHLP